MLQQNLTSGCQVIGNSSYPNNTKLGFKVRVRGQMSQKSNQFQGSP